MIHLDTSFLIRALDRGSPEDRRLRRWIRNAEVLGMSAVAWAELQCGPLSPTEMQSADGIVEHRLDFNANQAEIAAGLFNETGRRRGSFVDCMIAAAAIAESSPLATTNEHDFLRFIDAGLSLAS